MVIEYITDDLIFSSDEPDKSDEEQIESKQNGKEFY